MNKWLARLLIFASVGSLATPLMVAPAVLLGVVASIYMLREGVVGLKTGSPQDRFAMQQLSIAFGGWFIVSTLSALIHRDALSEIDTAFRFLIALGGFWIVLVAAERRINWFNYGIVAGSIGAGLIAIYQSTILDVYRVAGWANNTIYFGNLSTLLSIYTVIILYSYRDRLSVGMQSMLWISLLLSLFASLASMSRSSFLSLLALAVLVRLNYFRIKGWVFIVFGFLVIIVGQEMVGHSRYEETVNEIRSVQQGDFHGPIGQRLKMWEGSILLFQSAPLLGIGADNYRQSILNLVEQNSLNFPESALQYNQPHSAILDALVCKGIIGLIAYLLLFLAPYRMIGIISKNGNAEIELLCKLSKATIFAFFIFGLTNSIFRIQVYAVTYSMSLAVFTAMILNFRSKDNTP